MCACAGFRPTDAQLEVMLGGVQQKVAALTPQHISNILMALGKMEFPAPAFLAAVTTEAMPKLSQFNAQALSNTVRLLTCLGFCALTVKSAAIETDSILVATCQTASATYQTASAAGRCSDRG